MSKDAIHTTGSLDGVVGVTCLAVLVLLFVKCGL